MDNEVEKWEEKFEIVKSSKSEKKKEIWMKERKMKEENERAKKNDKEGCEVNAMQYNEIQWKNIFVLFRTRTFKD